MCFINDPDVIDAAKRRGTTRAATAVVRAIRFMEGGICVIGNAPTALFRALEVIEQGLARPALVIGLPVGFVNAAESKAALIKASMPFISNVGRKGGSNVAASVVNGLAKLVLQESV
jgi:precorrin-8X/cobalt-precorrin-8 methylmutase